jgi:hypothetical protein
MPFTAAAPASYPPQWHPVVVAGGGYLFAASFEGVGGPSAARHCAERCHGLMLAALRAGCDPEAALRAMWRELDATFFAGPYSDRVGVLNDMLGPVAVCRMFVWLVVVVVMHTL